MDLRPDSSSNGAGVATAALAFAALACTEREALLLQAAAFAGNEPESSYLEVRPLKPAGAQQWVPVRELRQAVDAVMHLREHHEVFLGVNPRTRRVGKAEHVARCWCLLADCDSREAVERLRHFKPRPSIVVESSVSKLHAYWPLRHAVAPEWARRANLRLAHALGADTACADPARVMRAIGSVHHKSEPLLVRCVRLELRPFELAEVIAGLPDERTFVRPRTVPRPWPERADRALAGAADVVRGAGVGNRNNALNWAAFRLAPRVAELGEDTVRERLRSAGAAAGLSDTEIERTITSGLRAGMAA